MEFKKYGNYDVYEDGRVYSHYVNRFLKGSINKFGYLEYVLVHARIKAHRLVGELFLDCPDNYDDLVINHKDGNKLNNHYSNLEWVTTDINNKHARDNGLNNISKSNSDRWKNLEWANKTSENISKGMLDKGSARWKNNGRFKYNIFDIFGNEYSRKEFANRLGLSQSWTDVIIKRLADGNMKSDMYYVVNIKK